MTLPFVRASVYKRVITILNRESDRAKGSGKRAKRNRAEVAALIGWLANDPAFEWEAILQQVKAHNNADYPQPMNMHRTQPTRD